MGKSREFPFMPKSNKFLEAGDFFGMPLPNGRWACGVVLGCLVGGRTAFIGGLFDWSGDRAPLCSSLGASGIPDYSTHHVKTISSFGLSIDGNCPIDQSGFGLRQHVFDVYRGGIFEYSVAGDERQDRSVPSLGATSMGGLYARAIRLYGGMEDQEEIRLYLLDLRESVAAGKK